jgi:hypothetical protein
MAWPHFIESLRMRGAVRLAGLGSWACLAPLLASCSQQLPGVVSADGYVSGRHALHVRKGYDAPAAAGLMPEGWKLDNFNDDVPKRGDAYQTFFHVDVDGDGDTDFDETEPAFELRFVHLRNAGVVWLRAVAVQRELASTDLRVLNENYLEALAGGEYERQELGPGRKTTVEKRFAASLLSSEPCRLAAQECESATIELANVDQLKLDPNYRSHKLRVVIARTSFTYTPRRLRGRGSYPVYLLVGYLNQPRQFEAGLPDFAAFLQRIEISGQHGFQTTTAPVAVAAAAGPPVAQAAEAPPVAAPAPTPAAAAAPASP